MAKKRGSSLKERPGLFRRTRPRQAVREWLHSSKIVRWKAGPFPEVGRGAGSGPRTIDMDSGTCADAVRRSGRNAGRTSPGPEQKRFRKRSTVVDDSHSAAELRESVCSTPAMVEGSRLDG